MVAGKRGELYAFCASRERCTHSSTVQASQSRFSYHGRRTWDGQVFTVHQSVADPTIWRSGRQVGNYPETGFEEIGARTAVRIRPHFLQRALLPRFHVNDSGLRLSFEDLNANASLSRISRI